MGVIRKSSIVRTDSEARPALLNEHQWPGDVVELQLAHDETRASYNAAQHLPKRREMMQWWADYLDDLRAARPADGAKVVPIRWKSSR